MNIFGRLIRKLPVTVLALLALVAFVVGSHAAMDYLVHENMGECVSVGASAEFCLMPTPPLSLE